MDLAHFVAATIGQKSTPKKCTVLSAVQSISFAGATKEAKESKD